MDRFYPKNFVLWRPQLLLLLIFLEVVYDCTGNGGGLVEGAQIVKRSTRGGYGQHCTSDSECRQEFRCDKFRQECVCWNLRTSKLALFYNKKLDKCVSVVGKICTFPEDSSGLVPIDCVPNAVCVRPENARNDRLSSVFGICQCNSGWEKTHEHDCKPAMVIQVGDGDPIFTMAQRRVMEDGQQGSGDQGSVVGPPGGNHVMQPAISEDSPDPNQDLHKPREVLEQINKNHFDPASAAAASNRWECFKTKMILFMLPIIFNFIYSL